MFICKTKNTKGLVWKLFMKTYSSASSSSSYVLVLNKQFNFIYGNDSKQIIYICWEDVFSSNTPLSVSPGKSRFPSGVHYTPCTLPISQYWRIHNACKPQTLWTHPRGCRSLLSMNVVQIQTAGWKRMDWYLFGEYYKLLTNDVQ